MSDLRESGAIEQDGDTVAFIYREYEYLRTAGPRKREREADDVFAERLRTWETRIVEIKGRAQLLIRKNRHGPAADVDLTFDGARTRFGDCEARLV